MTDIGIPLQRLRLEVDRSLRGRAFFARTVTGHLHASEYVELLAQLCHLLDALTCGLARELVQFGEQDVAALAVRHALPAPGPCQTVRLLSRARQPQPRPSPVSQRLAYDLAVAVTGTSWTIDAVDRLTPVFPSAMRLLTALSTRAPAALSRAARRDADAHALVAFAELARGALLGLAAHLDLTWPAPMQLLGLDSNQETHDAQLAPH